MLDKILKILWLVNGVLLLALLLFAGYRLFLEESDSYDYYDTETSLVIGGEQADALKKGEELQGVAYGQISTVPGTPIRVLPVSAQRFHPLEQEGERYSALGAPGSTEEINEMGADIVNLIFMDIDYRVINTLLSRKAFIQTAASPRSISPENLPDPTIKNILYLISFEDSNNDGLLSESDNSDLYISDVDGSNLVQVTRNVFVLDYKFISNNSEVLVSFKERDNSHSEYKPTRFAKYQISRESLIEMSGLHQELSKVEKLLQVDSTENKP
jgi:hypothetical protein